MSARAGASTRRDAAARLAADRERLHACLAERGLPAPGAASPAWICVRLHRWSHRLYAGGHTVWARFAWQLNLWITGADIAPSCELGPGLVVLHPFAVTIAGDAGRNLFVEGWGGMGGGMALDDVGAGPGLPVLGDDVHLDRGAMVLGPVRIGDRVRIGPGCTVVRDVDDDSDVAPVASRVRAGGTT